MFYLCGVKIELTIEAQAALKRYQRETDDKSVYTKVPCILMLSKGFSAEDVSQSLGIDVSSVYRYAKSYSSVGLSEFIATDYKGYWGRLSSAEISILRTELKSKVYTDSAAIAVWIKERFGVNYTPEGTVDLLNLFGFLVRKTNTVE